MIYTLDGELHLSDVPTPLLHQLIRELTVPNPRYENALRLGRPAWNIPRTIMLYEIKGNALTLPRGMAEEVWRQRPAGTVSKDRTLRGEPCAFEKAGFTLRDYQKQAVDAALACKWCQGVLVAPCGAGKTEIGMALIARLGRPALWITHTLDLAQQAKERAQLRLGLDDREVAVISGKSKRLGTKLTIATVQSLYRMELDELSRTVGVVIVDECHHVVNNPESASMFAAVLRCLPARWRFGLTASDQRSDGLSETIFQVLGPRVAVIDPGQLEQITITPRVETVPTAFVYTPRANESPIDYVRLMHHMAADEARMHTVETVLDRAVTEGTSWLVLAASLAVPSTPMELVSRLTEQLVTPGTFFTAFSTRAEQAAQLMPVTLNCSIAISPCGQFARRAVISSAWAAAGAVLPAFRRCRHAGHRPHRCSCAGPAAPWQSCSAPSSQRPPVPECPHSRHPFPACRGCRAPAPRCG